jgi:hypothetical protein
VEPPGATRDLESYRQRLYALSARASRLRAEKAGLPRIDFPKDIQALHDSPLAERLLANEQTILIERRKAWRRELDSLRKRVLQYDQEVTDLRSRGAAVRRQLRKVKHRLRTIESQLQQGVVYESGVYIGSLYQRLKNSVLELREDLTLYAEDVEQLEKSKRKVSEQIERSTRRHMERITKELADTQGEISVLRQWIDQAERGRYVILYTPVEGLVANLRFTRPDDVIPAGKPVLDIIQSVGPVGIEVPLPAHLETRVRIGLEALITFASPLAEQSHTIPGAVSGVSSRRADEQEATHSSVIAHVEIDAAELERADAQRPTPGTGVAIQFSNVRKMAFVEFLGSTPQEMYRSLLGVWAQRDTLDQPDGHARRSADVTAAGVPSRGI